ncbi:PREDICTED: epididymal-specific lipocalin-12 [Chrysochloris asiatica]|uniref:Epididymal-specific lipocalin-12 n=1 Tax=Chrysochloris asiatica TaxID=185453 RepID=A0A9B0TGW1_CHRAS|nr:PREDICTED: epididymal-specific lipocalin-12 [Chrysochloris asiatica]
MGPAPRDGSGSQQYGQKGPAQHPSQHTHHQSSQFQGAWYVVGLAGSTFKDEDRKLLSPYTVTFELLENSFQASYAMTRGQRCITWVYTLNPTNQPGHFEVDKKGDLHADSEEVQVTDTNYTTFGLIRSRRNSNGRQILRVSLLSRSWTLLPEALDKFICLVRFHRLSDEQIVFPALNDPPPTSQPQTLVPTTSLLCTPQAPNSALFTFPPSQTVSRSRLPSLQPPYPQIPVPSLILTLYGLRVLDHLLPTPQVICTGLEHSLQAYPVTHKHTSMHN